MPVVPVAMIDTEKVMPIGTQAAQGPPHRHRLRRAARLLALRGHGGRPVHPAVDHRRDHVRAQPHSAARSTSTSTRLRVKEKTRSRSRVDLDRSGTRSPLARTVTAQGTYSWSTRPNPSSLADPAVIAGLDYWRDAPDQAAAGVARRRRRRAPPPPKIATLPPLVFAGEVDILRDAARRGGRGEAFLLQGGDCAETFAGATADQIRDRVKTILQMAVVLTYGASDARHQDGPHGRPVRQAALERHRDPRRRDAARLPRRHRQRLRLHPRVAPRPTPRGSSRATTPPRRRSTSSAPSRRAGSPTSARCTRWNKGFASNPANHRYEQLADEIDQAIKFMEAAGADFDELQARRVLHEPRGPAHGLRAPDDAHRLAHRHAVQHVVPTSCGSASAPATSTAPTSTSSRACATRSA